MISMEIDNDPLSGESMIPVR